MRWTIQGGHPWCFRRRCEGRKPGAGGLLGGASLLSQARAHQVSTVGPQYHQSAASLRKPQRCESGEPMHRLSAASLSVRACGTLAATTACTGFPLRWLCECRVPPPSFVRNDLPHGNRGKVLADLIISNHKSNNHHQRVQSLPLKHNMASLARRAVRTAPTFSQVRCARPLALCPRSFRLPPFGILRIGRLGERFDRACHTPAP
jgi:hypothetical protein